MDARHLPELCNHWKEGCNWRKENRNSTNSRTIERRSTTSAYVSSTSAAEDLRLGMDGSIWRRGLRSDSRTSGILFISECAHDLSVKRQLYGRPMLSKPFTGDDSIGRCVS